MQPIADRIDLQAGAVMSMSIPAEARDAQGQRAGIVSRLLADAIDLFVVIAAVVVIHVTVSGLIFLLHPRAFTWPEVTLLRHGTLGWVLLVAYLTIGWSSSGRTVGKRGLGLRVVTSHEARLPLWRSFVRATLCCPIPDRPVLERREQSPGVGSGPHRSDTGDLRLGPETAPARTLEGSPRCETVVATIPIRDPLS